MIVGSGLLAQAFAGDWAHRNDVCIFASGVSDSGCVDPERFARERALLERALSDHADTDAFVYFGTCSANAPEVRWSAYVHHKVEMERLVMAHRRGLVLRLPQVAGIGGNPATLLNRLRDHVLRGTPFELWSDARRALIDVRDVVELTGAFIGTRTLRGIRADIAPPRRHGIEEIVAAIEEASGRRARYTFVPKGHDEPSDPTLMLAVTADAGARFDDGYLRRTVARHHRAAKESR
ncbi:MAG: hypothetical protein RIS35_27 [Pseudomonadota bacterium]|jgi:hypothetical protein